MRARYEADRFYGFPRIRVEIKRNFAMPNVGHMRLAVIHISNSALR